MRIPQNKLISGIWIASNFDIVSISQKWEKEQTFAVQILSRYKQRGQQTFFRQFWAVYSRFCSTLFAFWNSLKPVFPCTPCLSVAVYVVRNRCSTCTLRSGPARSQSKKVVKVKSVCPKHLQYNKNLRWWIAPLSTMISDFFNHHRKRTLCSSLNLYLCLSPF